MKSRIRKIFVAAALLAPVTVSAQDNTQQTTSFNPVLLGLVSIVVVLVLCIAALAYVYKQLALAYRDKLRKERMAGGAIVKTVMLLLATGIFSIQSFAQGTTDNVAETVARISPNISGIPRMDFYALLTIIGFELLAIGAFLGMIYRMVHILRDIPEKAFNARPAFISKLMHKLTKAVAVKDEASIVLDHDYDGIHELDNSLPPWWKWGFVFTIVFAGVYLWYYQFGGGPNQAQEYAMAVEKAEIEKAAYMAKAGNTVDETNVKMIGDKGELTDAAVLFKNTCAACHREDAGGNVGPNLTDNYWLHGGKLQDVFKSIKYGWKDKGMPEWKTNMSAKQIAGLASYIKMLSGKNVPGGKAPQGELFTESGDVDKKADTAAAKPATAKTAALTTETKPQKG
jgi:cytochrome c oxidase cbb3-type subunit 3